MKTRVIILCPTRVHRQFANACCSRLFATCRSPLSSRASATELTRRKPPSVRTQRRLAPQMARVAVRSREWARRPPRRRSSAARGGVRIAPKSRGRCTRPQERARARAAAERALARVEAPALAAAASASNPDSGRSMKRPAPGLSLHGHSRARARSKARSARRAAAAAARLARALAALHTQPLHSAATVMMTEATSDESVADSNTCMAPVPLRREETMCAGRQVPSRATKTRKLAVRPSP